MKTKVLLINIVLAAVVWSMACTVPSWVNTVESNGQVAAAVAESLTGVIDPALEPLVTLISNGFLAVANTVDTFKKSPTATNLQAVEAAFNAVNSNVAQLESAAQIKNSTSQAKVTGIVQLLTQAVTEIAGLVPKSLATVAVSPAPAPSNGNSGPAIANSGTVKHWTAKDFKREYNNIVKGDPKFKELK